MLAGRMAGALGHVVGVAVEAILVVAVAVALVVGGSLVLGADPPGARDLLAARGGGSAAKGVSIALAGGAEARTSLAYGDVAGTISTYGTVDPAWARMVCYANETTVTSRSAGQQVYDVMRVVREGSWSSDGYAWFDTRASSAWTSGGADCVAMLMTYRWKNYHRVWSELASVTFTVQP